ncbi:hypothetical protein ACS0TY_023121 [Phlomoides rotata]
MEDFIEPTLVLCKAILLRSVSSWPGSIYSKKPTLLHDSSSESNQHCVKDITDFASNVGALLDLSKSCETSVADLASECLYLLFKAAPREATMNFLMNLYKASAILDSGLHGSISDLVLERILHALGFSCRQYLLHMMILSICIPELVQISGALATKMLLMPPFRWHWSCKEFLASFLVQRNLKWLLETWQDLQSWR